MFFRSNSVYYVFLCRSNFSCNLFRYLGRFDEELEQLQLKHSIGMRKGRQHGNREDIIKMTQKNERNDFNTCGIGNYNSFM